jgi:hypothetical protein
VPAERRVYVVVRLSTGETSDVRAWLDKSPFLVTLRIALLLCAQPNCE